MSTIGGLVYRDNRTTNEANVQIYMIKYALSSHIKIKKYFLKRYIELRETFEIGQPKCRKRNVEKSGRFSRIVKWLIGFLRRAGLNELRIRLADTAQQTIDIRLQFASDFGKQ